MHTYIHIPSESRVVSANIAAVLRPGPTVISLSLRTFVSGLSILLSALFLFRAFVESFCGAFFPFVSSDVDSDLCLSLGFIGARIIYEFGIIYVRGF